MQKQLDEQADLDTENALVDQIVETIEGESELPKEQLPPVKPLDKAIVAFAGSFLGLAYYVGMVLRLFRWSSRQRTRCCRSLRWQLPELTAFLVWRSWWLSLLPL